MSDDPVREDWPFGPELKRHREDVGLGQREAARRTTPPGGLKPAVSAGRWKQLETGWQKNKGLLIPIGTTPATVAAAARAVEWDVREALRSAGFSDELAIDPTPPDAGIAAYSNDELIDEIRRRLKGAASAHDGQRRPPEFGPWLGKGGDEIEHGNESA